MGDHVAGIQVFPLQLGRLPVETGRRFPLYPNPRRVAAGGELPGYPLVDQQVVTVDRAHQRHATEAEAAEA